MTDKQVKETTMSETNELATIAQQDQMVEVSREQAVNMAKRIMPMFPQDCDKQQALEVARIALAYGLDPFLGELIPYKGKPYLTFDGRVRIADRHAAFDGYVGPEPPTEAEMTALRPAEGESIWKCTVYRKDRTHPTVAYGRAGGPQDRNPISKQDAVTMAQKRAVHRALRAAFPVPIPGLEEKLSPAQLKAIHTFDNDAGIDADTRHEELEATFGVESSDKLTSAQASAYIDGRVVDADTGEVTDSGLPRLPDKLIDRLEALATAANIEYLTMDSDALERYTKPGYIYLTADEAKDYAAWLKALAADEAEAVEGGKAELIEV